MNSSQSNLDNGRKLQLRALYDTVQSIEDIENTSVKEMKDAYNVLDNLSQLETTYPVDARVKHTDETILDLKIITSVQTITYNGLCNADDNSNNYQLTKYLESLVQKESNNKIKTLLSLKPKINKLCIPLTGFPTLANLINFEHVEVQKEKKPRSKREAQTQERKEPDKVTEHVKETDTITETVKFLTQILKMEYDKHGKKPVDYYKFVIDTSNFSKTVENIFYTSFVIRDGKCKFKLDRSGDPILIPSSSQELKSEINSLHNVQCITSITTEKWRALCEKLNHEPGYIQEYSIRSGRYST